MDHFAILTIATDRRASSHMDNNPLLKIRSFLYIQIDERKEKRNDPPKLQTLALKRCPFGLALINHFGWQTKMSKCHKKRCHPPNYFFPFCPYNFLVLSLLTMPYIIFGMHQQQCTCHIHLFYLFFSRFLIVVSSFLFRWQFCFLCCFYSYMRLFQWVENNLVNSSQIEPRIGGNGCCNRNSQITSAWVSLRSSVYKSYFYFPTCLFSWSLLLSMKDRPFGGTLSGNVGWNMPLGEKHQHVQCISVLT